MTANANASGTASGNVNAFAGRAAPPTEADLAEALGPRRALWDRLVGELTAGCGIDTAEWGSSSRKLGWSLRFKRGKRVIVYLAPTTGDHLLASFVLGDRAVRAAREAGLPDRVLEAIAAARRYAEGTGIQLPVGEAGDVAVVSQLVAIKLAN